MKKLFSGLMATALAASISISGAIPAMAAPVMTKPATAENALVQQVQDRIWLRRDGNRDGPRMGRDGPRFSRDRDGPRFGAPNRGRDNVRIVRRGDNHYFNGHRGYRYQRPGYRQYNGFWFPAAAFVAGAIVGGAINNQPAPVYRGGSGNAHVQWCANRYRSYRAYDNTFQPYNGGRQQCYSPYS